MAALWDSIPFAEAGPPLHRLTWRKYAFPRMARPQPGQCLCLLKCCREPCQAFGGTFSSYGLAFPEDLGGFLIPLGLTLGGFAAVVPQMAEPIPPLTARSPRQLVQDLLNCDVNFLTPGFQDGL